MKFKILKHTQLFEKLKCLQQKCIEANRATFDLAAEFGSIEIVPKSSIKSIAGGLSGIKLSKKPEGWMPVFTKYYSDVYYPMKRKANKEILDKIEALPQIYTDELNAILSYDPFARSKNERKISFCPGVYWHHDEYILVQVEEYVKYVPVDGMIEITVSEFNSLKGDK